jgi:hypothetical protein
MSLTPLAPFSSLSSTTHSSTPQLLSAVRVSVFSFLPQLLSAFFRDKSMFRAVRARINNTMTKRKLLLAAIIAMSILIPAAVRADTIQIQVGDKPFYNHGARYWDNDYEMVWAPGHMDRGNHWVHGQYTRGQHRRHDDHHDNEPHK